MASEAGFGAGIGVALLGFVMLAVVAVTVVALARYTQKRHWNADGEDDARRAALVREEE